MGKRKTKRKPKPKKKQVLDTQFDCIACHNEKSIEVKMQRDAKVGNLNCRICGIKFQSPINPLSDPVDVYYEWVDASQTAKHEDSRGISDDEIDEDSRLRGREDFGDDDEDYD